MLNHELATCDSMPWGKTQAEWIRRSAYYHLDKMKSALLITQYSTLPNDWWDIFASMRRLNKPIDMILFKNDNHPPMRPDVVLAAQQLTVDWFDFWLNDERATLDRASDHFKRWAEIRRNAAIDKNENSEEAENNQILAKMDCQKTDILPPT